MRIRLFVCALALPALPGLLPAQSPAVAGTPALPDPATKVARAVRLAGAAPHLDGRLDDEVWRQARWFSDFVQKEPVQGAEPTERTEIAFLYDADALYVGIRAYASNPVAIQSSVARRDGQGITQSEHVWISLDTYLDRRTAYSFGVTASGTRFDFYHPRDHEYQLDGSFDPVWEARTRVDSLGWAAELRIPFSQLRFRNQPVQVWGLNVDRWVPSRNEDIFWVPVPRNVTAWSSRMGTLVGIEGIRPSRRVELLPYAATNATVASASDPADPFDPHGRTSELRAGADLKMGLGPNLTLEATVNPDFGQVEADPAVVKPALGRRLLRGLGLARLQQRGGRLRGDPAPAAQQPALLPAPRPGLCQRESRAPLAVRARRRAQHREDQRSPLARVPAYRPGITGAGTQRPRPHRHGRRPHALPVGDLS